MISAVRGYRLISMLSLDVVAGAVISASFFSHVLSAQIGWSELLSLALTVWIIYTVDHLLDARRISAEASTWRHRFHQNHRKTLRAFVVVALVIDIVTVFFVHERVLIGGALLACTLVLFFIVQPWIPWFKELFIAFFYTCGVTLPALAHKTISLSLTHKLIIIHFMLVAIVNLLIFSWFDRKSDRRDGLSSIVIVAGERKAIGIIWLISILQIALTAIEITLGDLTMASLVIGSMGIFLLLIFVSRRTATDNEISRFLGEAVFLIPIVYLL